MIKTEHVQSLHFGVNFVLAPLPEQELTDDRARKFLNDLADGGLGIDKFERKGAESKWEFSRRGEPGPLIIVVGKTGPQVGQILITAPQPARSLDLFIREAEAACTAFLAAWPRKYQVVHRDVCLRRLFPTEGEHAFAYVWETLLGKNQDDLKPFGNQVFGGGLRIVAVPSDGEGQIQEAKIESFLRDPSKLFVEVQWAWNKPLESSERIDPKDVLEKVNAYATEKVQEFLGPLGDV